MDITRQKAAEFLVDVDTRDEVPEVRGMMSDRPLGVVLRDRPFQG